MWRLLGFRLNCLWLENYYGHIRRLSSWDGWTVMLCSLLWRLRLHGRVIKTLTLWCMVRMRRCMIRWTRLGWVLVASCLEIISGHWTFLLLVALFDEILNHLHQANRARLKLSHSPRLFHPCRTEEEPYHRSPSPRTKFLGRLGIVGGSSKKERTKR